MHVFIGGAYNGKKHYVKQWLEKQGATNVVWVDGQLPSHTVPGQVIVVHHLENILEYHDLADEETVADTLFAQLLHLDSEHQLIVIVTDMGRGIVPIEPKARQLRDVCGRLYQRLFKESETVTRVWYGLAEKLK